MFFVCFFLLGRMLQLILGCAVNCDHKQQYIESIMNLEESVQQVLMLAIQEMITSGSTKGNNIFSAFTCNILGSNQEYDPYQESLMAEECILVDADDKAIGKASKRVCHTIDPSTGTSPLHRAFSLFIFNCDNKLLLQQR